MKSLCKPFCVFLYRLLCLFGYAPCRVHGHTVSRVDACALNVLHNAGNQDIRAIADRIHFNLLSLHVLIYQYRVFLRDLIDNPYECVDILAAHSYLHPLPSQHIGRSYQYRISEPFCGVLRLLRRVDCLPFRAWNPALLQYPVKKLPVLRRVHILRRGSEYGYSHLCQRLRQLDCRLPAELHDCPVRLFQLHDALHILRGQRLKIKLVSNVKIRADRFRIVVYNDCLISLFLKCPGAVHGAKVELNSLSDSDGS